VLLGGDVVVIDHERITIYPDTFPGFLRAKDGLYRLDLLP
jgi:hypothetical protein